MNMVRGACIAVAVAAALGAQGVEFRTTTFAERWRDASASVEAAKAAGADLSLDIAAASPTTATGTFRSLTTR